MKNIREEKVTKGKVLVESTYNAGKATAFRQSIDLIVAKMDNMTDKDSNEYSVLNELLNEIWDKHNVVEKLESEANERMKELMHEKKALSQAGKHNDNA